MNKKRLEIKILISLIIYVISLGSLDYYRQLSDWNLYFDILAVFILVVFLFIVLIARKTENKHKIFSAAVILFSFVCIPLCFFIYGEFEGHRLLMFVPPMFLIAANFKGNTRINLLCFVMIFYIICATTAVSLPYFIEVEFIDPGFSVQLWTFALTVVLLVVLTILFISNDSSKPDSKTEFPDTDEGICFNFIVENAAEIKETHGQLEYHRIYLKIQKFMENFSDENTIIFPYCGDRFLMIIKGKNQNFVQDLAEGIAVSVNDELDTEQEILLGFSLYEKTNVSE